MSMCTLVAQVHAEQPEAHRLDQAIWKNLKELGHGG